MKTRKSFSLAMVTLITALTMVPTVFAQADGLRADVPFDFYVNDELVPAGTYVISTVQNGQIIQLMSTKGHLTMFAAADPTHNALPKTTRLVFNRYGNQNFLAQMHWAGRSFGKGVRASKLELEARSRSTPTRVAIITK